MHRSPRISARGDTQCIAYFLMWEDVGSGSYSRKEGNVNFYVHLRLRGRWNKVITKCPLAGMQYFDCISASGTVGSGWNVNF